MQEIDEMFKILSAVLSMGQIQFGSTDDDFAVVQDSAQPIQSVQVWKFSANFRIHVYFTRIGMPSN